MEKDTMEALIIIVAVVWIGFSVYKNEQYKKTAYYQITKAPYSTIKYNQGRSGEYWTYKCLQHFEDAGGKFLFNIYVPKANNEATEVDVLLICSKGLFVFESKNFSGWIFGNETQKNWTQTLPQYTRAFPRGRWSCHKEHFYNPIMQNASHIKYIRRLIGKDVPMHSIIVFSDACTFKNVTVKSENAFVVYRSDAASAVAHIYNQVQTNLTETEINDIYNKLYPYTQVPYEEREQHVRRIQISRGS
ncbi:MAG: nuclease-related domain-containing protein [Bdellovibrionales bacterium]